MQLQLCGMCYSQVNNRQGEYLRNIHFEIHLLVVAEP